MPEFFSNNIFVKLLSHADWLSQIIFWALICMSILCWSIFIFKVIQLHAKIKDARYAKVRLSTVSSFEELAHLGGLLENTQAGNLLLAAYTFLKRQNNNKVSNADNTIEQDGIRLVLNQELGDFMKKEELLAPVLKLSAETGTLIGLFGTVWGLIHAFNRIAERQNADIATVAPGIAEALIVTLTGLFVAIPALVHYFVVMKYVNQLEYELASVADRLEWISCKLMQDKQYKWGSVYENPAQPSQTK